MLLGEAESRDEDRSGAEGFDSTGASTEETPLGWGELATSASVSSNGDTVDIGEAVASGDELEVRQSHLVSEDNDVDVDGMESTGFALPSTGDRSLGEDPLEALPSKVLASLAFAARDRANGSPQSGKTVPFSVHDASPAVGELWWPGRCQ